MAATSIETSSPVSLNKGLLATTSSSSPPLMFSPSSDKRFWSTLHSRVDTLLENRTLSNGGVVTEGSKRMKEDTILLLRGFDSMAQSLSQLSDNLDCALQGARGLSSRPPTSLSEIFHGHNLEKAIPTVDDNSPGEDDKIDYEQVREEKTKEEDNRGMKRKKLDYTKEEEEEEWSNDDQDEEDSKKASDKGKKKKKNTSNDLEKLKKAKNLAIAMATKAVTMARELKSIRSDLSFIQERCTLLEEENKKLRDGIDKPDEDDDLVRLQLEALLAEKSRLANENANLKRENQCLHQLVEYHQLTTQDLSASYENLIRGMCLDFSSPREEETVETPKAAADIRGFSKSLDECFDDEE